MRTTKKKQHTHCHNVTIIHQQKTNKIIEKECKDTRKRSEEKERKKK